MDEIDERQKQLILSKIFCFYSELLAKYNEELYSPQTYEELLATFAQPEDVNQEALELALAWKYGKEDAEALRRNPKYLPIIDDLKRKWPDYVEARIDQANLAFLFFQENLGTNRFVTNAFLSHLLFPEDFPIVDRHNFRALRYFLDIADIAHSVRPTVNSNGLDEVCLLRDFIEFFSAAAEVDERSFDKYMMMFGKHVAPD